MIKGVRILNLDDSVVYQKNFVDEFKPVIVDLKQFNQSARMWAFEKTVEDIAQLLSPAHRNSLTFIGSSDYHHVSGILLKQYVHPITLIVFDHRPDWNMLGPGAACNSWVNREVKKVNIINVLAFGLGVKAMQYPWRIGANLKPVAGGRLKLYGHYTMPLLPKILKNIYTEDVYISIDKSCLKKEQGLTNWEEGRMSLEMVLEMIVKISKEKDIVGMDVSGEYSLPVYEHLYKSMFAKINRPKHYTAFNKSIPQIDQVNESTNIQIARAVLGVKI